MTATNETVSYANCRVCGIEIDVDPVPQTDCPVCPAGSGEICERPSGWKVWQNYHTSRIKAAVRRVCPKSGQPCWDDGGQEDVGQTNLDGWSA